MAKSTIPEEIQDPEGVFYWSLDKSMAFLGVGLSTLRKRAQHLQRYHPEDNKKATYYRKEDIEALRNAPVKMVPKGKAA